MESLCMTYVFTFPGGSQTTFELEVDSERFELIHNLPDVLPEWTALTFHQCPHCPLTPATHPYCPLAANLVNIVKRFDALLPYLRLHLDVVTPERTISQDTTIQAAVGSLMGFIMATSGCPQTAFFKPMARFHLPLANSSETMYRSVSMYMIAQYFLARAGRPADLQLDGLGKIYEDMHTVNMTIAERFLAASKKDSSVDAVVQLDIYAMTFIGISDETLQEVQPLFQAFFDHAQ